MLVTSLAEKPSAWMRRRKAQLKQSLASYVTAAHMVEEFAFSMVGDLAGAYGAHANLPLLHFQAGGGVAFGDGAA